MFKCFFYCCKAKIPPAFSRWRKNVRQELDLNRYILENTKDTLTRHQHMYTRLSKTLYCIKFWYSESMS